jgi:hypothetical protein
VEEFKNLYYQQHADCLHFCRPCIHTLLHIYDEVTQVGPGMYSTQFMMGHTIRDLGQEIRQPSNPFCKRCSARSSTVTGQRTQEYIPRIGSYGHVTASKVFV